MVQGVFGGREHHPNCFTMWLAGGGVKRGGTLGASDEFGSNVKEDRVHVHDLNATILHLLGGVSRAGRAARQFGDEASEVSQQASLAVWVGKMLLR